MSLLCCAIVSSDTAVFEVADRECKDGTSNQAGKGHIERGPKRPPDQKASDPSDNSSAFRCNWRIPVGHEFRDAPILGSSIGFVSFWCKQRFSSCSAVFVSEVFHLILSHEQYNA